MISSTLKGELRAACLAVHPQRQEREGLRARKGEGVEAREKPSEVCVRETLEQLRGVRGEMLLWVMSRIPFNILGDIQAIIRPFKTTFGSRTSIPYIGRLSHVGPSFF